MLAGLRRSAEPAGSRRRISHPARSNSAETPTLLKIQIAFRVFFLFFSFFPKMGDNIFAAVSSDRIKEYICLEIISSGGLTHIWCSRSNIGGIKSELQHCPCQITFNSVLIYSDCKHQLIQTGMDG